MHPLTKLPNVTLIMPIWNEAAFIEASLASVVAQDYPAECLEILVVDGMSTDPTRARVRALQARHPQVKMLDNPRRIVPAAINLALKEARGEIIVRVDGHCQIGPDYVRRCVEHLRADGIDCVGGAVQTLGATPMGEAIALAMSSPFGVGNALFRTSPNKTRLVDTVPFPAYKREVIERVGLFDEQMVCNEDDEYNYRLRKMGGKILLAADIRSQYYSRSSLPELWKQYYRYGLYKVLILQKHPRQMRARQFVPFLFLLALLVSMALAFLHPQGWLGFVLLAAAYLLAAVGYSIQISVQHGWRHFFRLLAAFLTLHLAYGSGFLTGLLRFGLRRDYGRPPLGE